jgi:hypothetical protein
VFLRGQRFFVRAIDEAAVTRGSQRRVAHEHFFRLAIEVAQQPGLELLPGLR